MWKKIGDAVIASHTGSGKTLAFLIPLIQRLKEEEQIDEKKMAKPHRPRALIVGPSRELATQVFEEYLDSKITKYTYV